MLLIDEFPVMEVGDIANHEHPIAFIDDCVHLYVKASWPGAIGVAYGKIPPIMRIARDSGHIG
jgi:hypothetical protein